MMLGYFFSIVACISVFATDPLPVAQTEHRLQIARTGKPTAGDVVELVIHPPADQFTSAEIAPEIKKQLETSSVEWGTGRILWWKSYDAQSGVIIVGLTSYIPGVFEVRPIVFFKDGVAVFTSAPQFIEYSSVGGEKDKDDLYPPVRIGFPQWVLILLGVSALALVLAGLWALARWSKARRLRIEILAKAPRILNALDRFEKIRAEVEAKGFIEKQTYKPHYFALSEASKRFIGEAYRFDAEEKTTRELVSELELIEMASELIEKWRAIFDEMDVTKFTDKTPDSDVARSLSLRLTQLVKASYYVSPAAKEEREMALLEKRTPKSEPQVKS